MIVITVYGSKTRSRSAIHLFVTREIFLSIIKYCHGGSFNAQSSLDFVFNFRSLFYLKIRSYDIAPNIQGDR